MTTLEAGPQFNGWGDVGQDEFGFVALGDVEGVALVKLNRIQTDVAEELTVPWPGRSGDDMGEPWAKVENGVLKMAYVNAAGEQILQLPAIQLSELMTDARPPMTDWDDSG